jgi:hypothetical protein
LRNNHGLSKSNANNDNSKQEQLNIQILCFNGGEFEQKVQHMLKALYCLGNYNNKCLNLACEQANAQTTSKWETTKIVHKIKKSQTIKGRGNEP